MRLLRFAVLAVAVITSLPAGEPAARAAAGAVPVHHTSTGGVKLVALPGHGLANHATNNPTVDVLIPSPSDTTARVRLSNDAQAWVERPLATSIRWSLTDAASGGIEEDGFKTVHVEFWDGTTWRTAGSDYLYLDRVAPTWPDFALENGAASVASWKPRPTGTPDDFSGITGTRTSLDGVRWGPWGEVLDLRLMDYGGSWALGERTVWVQARDGAGNLSAVLRDTINVTQPPLSWDEGTVPVRFEFPRQPVTGQLFTIRPIFPPGYVLPSNAWCDWRLHWGDEQSLYGLPNENYGEIIFERPANAGGCKEWTFTLPWVPVRTFDFNFNLVTKTSGQQWGEGTGLYSSPTWKINAFSAALGGTSPHITSSTHPLVYLLPDSTLTQLGDPVTYRLHASGGLPIPQTGSFWTYPVECYMERHWSQEGGTSFTYTPNCAGNWVTGWTGTYKGGYMRSVYDPVVDGKPPVVKAPVVRLDRRVMGTTPPVLVSWSASDDHSSIYAYELQVSRGGGAWTAVALPTARTASIKTSLPVTTTTRYRVRARDRVGNWSGWAYGPTIRGAIYEETYRYISWSRGWSTTADPAWSGDTARRTTTANAAASFKFTGRSVAWVARNGPTNGLVQIYLDGVLASTVDLRSPTVGPPSVRFSWTWGASGTRTVTIKNLGTAGSPGADFDAFLVAG